MAMTLDEHLGAVMAERSGIGKDGAATRFHDALAGSAGMVEQANIRLRHLEGSQGDAIVMRDHVSRMHKLILTEALSHV